MYGLWLYKEFATEYGKCRLEIHQKDYSGQSEEIEAFAADSLVISLDNLSEIISPIGKTVCTFGIINTNQFDYDVLFTPDATKFLVKVKTQAEGEEWVNRWGGFLTPDFFAEDLQHRSIISLSARDCVGYLNDLRYDYEDRLISIGELFNTAFSRISPDYPMSVVFESGKLIDGVGLRSVYVSSDLFNEGSWGEAVETILHDCGLQMRWVDYNTIKVYDLSNMLPQFEEDSIFFVKASGYREILPAWKTLKQSQDYVAKGDLYDGVANGNLMTLDHTEQVILPYQMQTPALEIIYNTQYYYKLLSKWSTAWNAYTAKNIENPLNGVYIGKASSGDARVQDFIAYKRTINKADYPLTLKFSISKTLHFYKGQSEAESILTPFAFEIPFDGAIEDFKWYEDLRKDFIQLNIHISILLHADNGRTYYLNEYWSEYTEEAKRKSILNFTLNKATYGDIANEDVSITCGSMPYNGQIEVRLHGYSIADNRYTTSVDTGNLEYTFYPTDWNAFFAKIESVSMTFESKELPSGVTTGVMINSEHNLKRDESFTLNTLPISIEGETVVINGLYNGSGVSFHKAKLDGEKAEYDLIELVGREMIHYNIRNYEKLSGVIKSKNYKPLYFDRSYIYKNKTFIPYAYRLYLISNEIAITSMQEVVPYERHEFTEISSELTSGSTTLGGGNSTAFQYSANAGNARRIYQLSEATNTDAANAFLVIDKDGLVEAKKFPLSRLLAAANWFELRTLNDGSQVLVTPYNLAIMGEITAGGVSEDNTSTILMQRIEELQAEIDNIKAQINEQ